MIVHWYIWKLKSSYVNIKSYDASFVLYDNRVKLNSKAVKR